MSSPDGSIDRDREARIREWIAIGEQNGWCSPLFCESHDPVTSPQEDALLDLGADPCLWSLRVWIASPT